ncbi:MAG: hypothetical protein MI974_15670 [Chitinophagales bacterium]|nr:hypothetical protein [Chitinophagales bacterium]
MRNLLFIAIAIIISSCATNYSAVNIPAGQTVELDYPNYEVYKASLKNRALKGIEVAVLSKQNERQIRGFGLGMKAKADVMVEMGNKLSLRNNNSSAVKIDLGIAEESAAVFEKEGQYVSLYLLNKSAESIPLIIPTVMNPNLSPFSRSGVDLKVGQEILFRARGKRYVLLTVDDSIQEGEELDVAVLLEKRKEELGL